MGALSIKIRMVGKNSIKISLIGCKLSSLNAPSTETPVVHSLLNASLFPISSPCSFLSSSLFWVIRNGSPQYKGQEGGNIFVHNQLNRIQKFQFECPRVRNPCVSSTLREFPYHHFPLFHLACVASVATNGDWRNR